MQIGSMIAIYFVIWWITLFAVLPFGVRSQAETGDITPGSEPGAPTSVRVRRIVMINSIVALGVLGMFWAVYVENIFGLSLIADLKRS